MFSFANMLWVDRIELTGEFASSTYAWRDGCIMLGNCFVLKDCVWNMVDCGKGKEMIVSRLDSFFFSKVKTKLVYCLAAYLSL